MDWGYKNEHGCLRNVHVPVALCNFVLNKDNSFSSLTSRLKASHNSEQQFCSSWEVGPKCTCTHNL